MKPADKQKMCSNCDGRIPYDAQTCPYCAAEQADVEESNSFQAPLFKNQTLQESLASLYTPPYGGRGPAAPEAEEKPAPKKKKEAFKEVSQEKKSYTQPASFGGTSIPMNTMEEEEETGKSPLMPILALSVGANLLTLGLLQLLFSDGGFLRLEWNASYWFIYTLLSLPLFYFGYKKATKL